MSEVRLTLAVVGEGMYEHVDPGLAACAVRTSLPTPRGSPPRFSPSRDDLV